MKNRDKLKSMTIDGKEYLWNYYYDDMDFSHYPYSYYLFVPKNNQRLKVRVYFTRYAPQMNLQLYPSEGTVCFYQGKQVILNLCRPCFAKQVIEYVFENCCQDMMTGEVNLMEGDTILQQLGYSGFY